jgi:hypothetical protein
MEYTTNSFEQLKTALNKKLSNLLGIEVKSKTASNSLCDMLEILSDIHHILAQADSRFRKYSKTRSIFDEAILNSISNYLKKDQEKLLDSILKSKGMQTLQKGQIGLFHNIVWQKKHSDKVKAIIQNYKNSKSDNDNETNAENRSNLYDICNSIKDKVWDLRNCIDELYEKHKNSESSGEIYSKLRDQFELLKNIYDSVKKIENS